MTGSQLERVQETARITWPELEPHFARGVILHIDSHLDLVQVAAKFVDDDKAGIQALLERGQVEYLSTDSAKDWCSRLPELWAVVAAPWVLVQERRENDDKV
ncbi:MAG: DUF2288 domain-containing protein [Gammaproteobacteria bacterium]